MSNYTTIQGDTWDVISLKTLGSEMLVSKLIEANSKHRNTIYFSAGIILNIPVIENVQKQINLPPWKL